MNLAFCVGFGGLVGSILRYGIAVAVGSAGTAGFPSATILVNIVGSFLMGAALAFGRSYFGEALFHFLVPGLLGGFTTYSAFAGESLSYLLNGKIGLATALISLTFLGGLSAAWLGFLAGKSLGATY